MTRDDLTPELAELGRRFRAGKITFLELRAAVRALRARQTEKAAA